MRNEMKSAVDGKLKKGFTLIELLVVIAIIGILATIIIVSLKGMKDKANDAALKSIVHSLQLNAVVCTDSGSVLKAPTDLRTGGGNFCANTTATSVTWPNLSKYKKIGAIMSLDANGSSNTDFKFHVRLNSGMAFYCGPTGCVQTP